MYNHIIGKITFISKKYLLLESGYLGYKIFITNKENFELNKGSKIYIHRFFRIDNKNCVFEDLYGFSSCQERNLFADLLTIPGIGIITACNIISNNDYQEILNCIKNNNIHGLEQMLHINHKIATLIISELSIKYNYQQTKINDKNTQINNDLIYALKQLGYKKADIDWALSNCDHNLPLNEIITKSIQIIAKQHDTNEH